MELDTVCATMQIVLDTVCGIMHGYQNGQKDGSCLHMNAMHCFGLPFRALPFLSHLFSLQSTLRKPLMCLKV